VFFFSLPHDRRIREAERDRGGKQGAPAGANLAGRLERFEIRHPV
jgi:hypothetical protein